ncbi:MAG: thioredoxin domain-containing protein [Patescibacteria group bacterium]
MKKFIQSLFVRERFTRVTLPLLLVIILVIIGLFSFQKPNKTLSTDQAKTQTETFINTYLMQSGNKATVKEVTTEYGLYKLKIDIVSDLVESYLSKDGKLFFPQALNIEQISSAQNKDSAPSAAAPSAVVTKKSDKPTVELFVMSYCPYGTQVEKGILPVLEALGNKIAFELKFCSYAMHGQKELAENLNQYCIQKEQPEKLNSYLQCFLEASDSASCLTKAGVKTSQLNACVAKTDKQFKVYDNFNNKVDYQGSYPGFAVQKTDNEKYNVGGSPTLIINGEEISSNRDSASLLKTICSAFNTPPKECETVLSSASPAPGFGSGTATNNSAAAGCAQ